MSYPQKVEKVSASEVIRRITKQSDPAEISAAVDAALRAQFANAKVYQEIKKRRVELTEAEFFALVTPSRRQRMERAMAKGQFERMMKGRFGYVLTWKNKKGKETGLMNKDTAAYLNREDSERACQFGPGDEHSEESKAAIAEYRRGKKASDITRAKISKSKIGKARDEETRAAISAGLKGKAKSPEQIEKMRAAAKARWAAKRAEVEVPN